MSEQPMAYEEVPGTRTLQQAVDQPQRERWAYEELRPGDKVQEGDQWLDKFGKWQPYVLLYGVNRVVGYGVRARRPISATQPTTYEEVPGSRTTQQAVDQPQRQRWAYEELQAGDLVQDGDQWLNPDGRWQAIVLTPEASMGVGEGLRVRRPHNITMMLAAFASSAEVLADAQQAATQLQSERDEFQAALIESRLALKRKVAEVMEVCKERDNAESALKSAQRARDELQLQVDELRADRTSEVTARQVQQVLHRWATELEWSADCFGSGHREQIHGVQNTLIAVMQRIESMIDAEGSRAND